MHQHLYCVTSNVQYTSCFASYLDSILFVRCWGRSKHSKHSFNSESLNFSPQFLRPILVPAPHSVLQLRPHGYQNRKNSEITSSVREETELDFQHLMKCFITLMRRGRTVGKEKDNTKCLTFTEIPWSLFPPVDWKRWHDGYKSCQAYIEITFGVVALAL